MKEIRTIFLLLFLGTTSVAQTIHSAYISQQRISTFEISADFFLLASNADSNLQGNDFKATISCPLSGKEIELTGLTLVKKEANAISCLTSQDLWRYQFQKSINLDDNEFLSIKSCCNLRLDLQVCCRDNKINTINNISNSKLYVFTEFENCGSSINKSSVLSSRNTMAMACANSPFYFNIDASDLTEYDSLSFEMASPLTDKSSSVTYVTGLSEKSPLKIYDPTGKGIINPTSNPPIGFFLNSSIGDIIFTPTKPDEKSAMAIVIVEWRTDGSGKKIQVGKTHMELGVQVSTCPGNNPPIIDGPYLYNVCEGTRLCFNVTTDDKVKVPPPPLPKPDPDTVTIKWNRGIPDATFTVTNPTALHQTGKFCWTPDVDMSSKLPYSFIVTARDDYCPLNALNVRAFTIRVNSKPQGRRDYYQVSDSQHRISYIDASRVPPISLNIMRQLRDSSGNILLNRAEGHFASTGSSISTNSNDTLVLNRKGIYIIQTTVTNSPGGCTTNYFDTLSHYSLNSPTFDKTKLLLYPNPADDKVNFGVKIGAGNTQPTLFLDKLTVIDNLGKIVLEASNTNQIITKDLPPGIYMVAVVSDGQTYLAKLTILHP
jgi:Secretion system C-terminal sorting domain